ncbi:uncharacterized protein LOC134957392 [Pseudophryne corroboree]|uniref:uncharacterized protein LOC134957392 n=1 Tax=Pseudophryne corroboree TaxID=495146 RepID=UPI003081F4A0
MLRLAWRLPDNDLSAHLTPVVTISSRSDPEVNVNMARNEEKQLGKLNRLWLQREKEEGRVKDISNRPRLSSLHKASDVKKWIPSIKSEIEYYLEQSHLIHYSDRKIQEFQEKIEALKKEYQSHLWKLRRLDPSCKEHPWKPRGYTRKRAADGKAPSWIESGEHTSGKLLCLPVLSDTASKEKSDSEEEISGIGEETPVPLDLRCADPPVQDAPLVFNSRNSHPKHLWQRSPYNTGGDTTDKLKEILLSSHPGQNDFTSPGNGLENRTEDTAGKTRGLLGVDCYSSSEEDT